MKTSFRYLVICSVVFEMLGKVGAADQAGIPADLWLAFIKSASLSEIAGRIEENKPAWPPIRSTFYISHLPPEERAAQTKALVLAHEFRAKLASTMRGTDLGAAASAGENLDTFSRLANRLRRSGGYSNLVLADSLDRLLIVCVADWIIENPGDAAKARVAMGKHPVAEEFDIKRTVSDLVEEDPYLYDRRAQVAAIAGNKTIYEALAPIGIGMKEIMAAMQNQRRVTSHLLNEPSAVALTARLAETDALRNVHLAGLLAFFERGGHVDELDPADETAFEKRMGKNARNFRSVGLQIRYLSSEHLLALIQMHTDPNIRASFLSVILN